MAFLLSDQFLNILLATLTIVLSLVLFTYRREFSLAKSMCEEAFSHPENYDPPQKFGPKLIAIASVIIFLTGVSLLFQTLGDKVLFGN